MRLRHSAVVVERIQEGVDRNPNGSDLFVIGVRGRHGGVIGEADAAIADADEVVEVAGEGTEDIDAVAETISGDGILGDDGADDGGLGTVAPAAEETAAQACAGGAVAGAAVGLVQGDGDIGHGGTEAIDAPALTVAA